MRHWLVVGAFAAILAAPVMAQQMNAELFHKRAKALEKKGALALFSKGEISALMTEASAAGKASGAQRKAALTAGQKPRFCPPAQRAKMNSSEFMRALGAIPAAERSRIDMTEAMTRIMATKFPCPA